MAAFLEDFGAAKRARSGDRGSHLHIQLERTSFAMILSAGTANTLPAMIPTLAMHRHHVG
jgi:hypothetical protein